ncbi:putative Histidine kinase [Syntrophobacter sp. SbD1]|nr:putative Histidine kinase [Syntrophobacter sp. SbD1]
MQDEDKSKEQLITELKALRQRVAESEKEKTERKQVEEFARLRLALFDFSGSHSLEELVQETIDEVCALTKSPIGFYHFVESDQKTLSLQAWSTRTLKEFCKPEFKGAHYPIGKAGVWADCARERRPVIHNEYSALPHRKGMPEGHVEVIRQLVVPVIRSGRIVAILGIGNKPSNYTENDVEIVSYLADVAWEVTERKRAEESLRLNERRLHRAEVVACFGNWELIRGDHKMKASEGARIIYGLEGSEWSMPEVQSVPLPEYRGMLDNALKGLIEEGKPYNVEFKIRRPTDGKIIDIHSIAEYSSEKEVVFGVIQDITERKRAEAGLRESEELYRTLVRLSPDAISMADQNGLLTFSSPKARQMFGHSPDEEILGRNLLSSVVPEEQEKASANIRHLMTEGTLTATEFTLLKKDGTSFIGEVNAAVIHSPDGGPMRIIIITRDVTERKRAEDALRQSERNYREIFNTANDAIFVHDADTGTILDVNDSMLHLFGFSREEALRLSPNDSSLGTSPYSAVEVRQWMAKAIEEGPQVFEWHARKKSGELFWVEVALKSADISGQRRMLAIVRDMTERKQAEDSLRESEERFSKFFRASPVGTSIARWSDGPIVDANDAFLRLFGYTRQEVIGHNPFELGMWANPDERTHMVETLQKLGGIQDFETRFRRKSGEIMDALISAEVIEVAGQRYILGLTHDITERKKAIEEKKKLEAQLFQAQKMESVGRLAGGVAHDFNNMLGVIIGRAEMALQLDISNHKLQHNLQEILKAALRSADLTRQLLAFARKQTAIPKIMDLNDTISGMLQMLRRLIGEDIDLSCVPGLDLWKVKIDPSQVDQILANLVVNACDAISEAGAITMITENVVIDDSNRAEAPEFIPGQYVLLTVSDTGAGMSQEVRENIFEPFFTTKELGKGTGLGLSTVYGIVKQNDGFIYVASEPGKGTKFKIYLPRFKAETEQIPSEEITVNRPTGTETILLVEDDEAILNLSKTILENLGYAVFAAHNPVYALHLAKEHPGDIHLLITDVVMPEMNGRELAEKLSTICPNLKYLYMSGYPADVIAHHGILDVGLNFIQKPFGKDDLAAKVRQVLDHLE